MLALFLAASLAAGAPLPTDAAPRAPSRLNLAPGACHREISIAAGPLASPKTAKLRPLGDLPKANHEIAVDRRVNGCAVPLIVSYEVDQDGHFAVDSDAGK